MSFLPQLLVQTSPNSQRLRDIKPPFEVPPNLFPYIILGMIILAVLFGMVWLYLRKRKSAPPTEIEDVVIFPPHEIALEKLNTLDSISCDLETYHTQISYIIREYISARYNIPALELTTVGLLRQMSNEQIDEIHVKHVRNFLFSCDIVKFTKYQPKQTEADVRMEDARQFVEETKIENT